MRLLDQRLLARARAARRLLILDSALGLVGAVLVVVQATLIARIVTRAFDGAPLRAVAVELGVLAVTFAGRGAIAWGFEVAGRRAAWTVLSELRLALVERRLRTQPAGLDGVEAGEIAATAVQGVDGLEAYFGRYLPQVVLAAVVPFVVLAWVATIDVGSALLLLITLPLVPLFMWLIGRYTSERTRERWLALRLLSTHFLDVARGLPTLRAFNRSRAQAAVISDVGERYRRAAMGTLRVSFRRHRAAGRADGADPRARAVRAASTARRPVPCERRRRRRCGADAGTARGARLRRPVREAGAV
ncbi:MAG: hypothetical protein AUH17_01270 [Actinobacteria bacterium 13_2_20CM_68_14]|nr:MAG: hypothetical protein AUH17_01270 [Actinobacteria bacterium 13_2_20CM_68_14]